MTCTYCRCWNADDEHRCRRCGRRLSGTFAGAQSGTATAGRAAGALATAAAPVMALEAAPVPVAPPAEKARTGPAYQPSLFHERPLTKVIPFASIPGAKVDPRPARPKPQGESAPARTARRASRVPEAQGALDFLPPAPASARTLPTTVEAVIFCDAPVATPMHRAVSSVLDLSMVLIAFGLFLWTYRLGGGAFTLDKLSLAIFGAAFGIILMFYGAVWALARADTPGMGWTYLRLTNFDGFPPDAVQRWMRFFGTSLSVCSAGLGILWALVDEESLTWQDHISKTFPTFREMDRNFVRKR